MFARMPWFSIHWHVFDSDAVDKPLRPLANRFCGCSVWALAPFFVVFGALLFASLFPLAKRKSGWGICGSSCLVVFCGFCVLFCSICLLKMDILCPCTNVFPTAYAHVRTEPLARHRPNSRKKNGSWLSHIDTGMRAFSSAQGPGLSSKCSAEVLDRQLVSAVLRSSVG